MMHARYHVRKDNRCVSSGRRAHRIGPWLLGLFIVASIPVLAGENTASPAGNRVNETFFTTQVLPILEARCFECHAHEQKIKGGLALDSPSGLRTGGEGGPILVPGSPEESRLITAVRHIDKEFQMPPKSKLSDEEIAVLVEWVQQGAIDPRPEQEGPVAATDDDWAAIFQERLRWWSLQPVATVAPPAVENTRWPRNEVDQFTLSTMETAGLTPVAEADPRALVRRLSFALTGLPPQHADVENFAANPTPEAYEALVQSYLANPHFGEQWARHWMDVVHYADTHGYEWDAPAKNAWRYRDYLIRAFNDDISYQRLIREQIAGDLLEPRVDPETGLNESIIGPMAMRLGERRHGDNADAEGVTQEAVANIIDTVSKGFLATTVACAQCHDHKLDAVAQRDYYSLAGVLMSSRWIVRSAEVTDPNGPVIDALGAIKKEIRNEIGSLWRDSRSLVAERIAPPAPPTPEAATEKKKNTKVEPVAPLPFPESLPAIWNYVLADVKETGSVAGAWQALAEEFSAVRAVRIATNQENMILRADFTGDTMPEGWRIDGLGMKYGLVTDGALVIADEGNSIVAQVLPAGRWSHVWSKRLEGAVRSELFSQDPTPTISLAYGGGDFAAQSLVVDNAFHSERMRFLKQPTPGWLTFTAGNLAALAGDPDPTPRQVYLELVTKSLNNYYPPRDKFGGLNQAVENDPRSWFGITRAYDVPAGFTPGDELGRFDTYFAQSPPPATAEALAAELSALVMAAVEHWHAGTGDGEDVKLLNEALGAGWLPNDMTAYGGLAQRVARYREVEKELQPARVIGGTDDWHEGRDTPIGIRGSYTTFGESVPRGTIQFLDVPGDRVDGDSSGRLELAHNFSDANNPLTARVYVNRVWHHLFGAGLVRTVDDFGHLGELPSHPELLDWMARRFMEEGWSTKKLIAMLVSSATWRQSSTANPDAVVVDPENRLWHHMPLRRLEAEAIRDAMLAASGRLDGTLYGLPIDPYRVAEDSTKRLYAGPLDGNGRRSIYQKMTLMEPPRFLAVFNQPIPKVTTGRRDTTNVPNQALALLNDPFVVAMAAEWSTELLAGSDPSVEARIGRMFQRAFARPPKAEETARFVAFANECATYRNVEAEELLASATVWQDVAHSIFNVKEFIYVP
mgnify:CR=1 FL=1